MEVDVKDVVNKITIPNPVVKCDCVVRDKDGNIKYDKPIEEKK